MTRYTTHEYVFSPYMSQFINLKQDENKASIFWHRCRGAVYLGDLRKILILHFEIKIKTHYLLMIYTRVKTSFIIHGYSGTQIHTSHYKNIITQP